MQTEPNPQIQTETEPESSRKAGALRLKQIGLCFGLFAAVGLGNGATGVLLPDIGRFYHVDNAVVGLLYMGENIGYALSAFCSGSLVEKLGLRRLVSAGLIIFTLSCLLVGIAPPFLIVLLTRPAIGFGTAIMEASANFFVASLPRRTTVLNYLHSFFGAGSLIGPLVATFVLAAGWGWNSVYLVWLLLGLPLLWGCNFLFPARIRSREKASSVEQPDKGRKLMAATLAIPAVWLGAIFLVVYVGIEIGVGAWAYTFLTQARSYDLIFSGWAVSGYWSGLTLGRLTLAALTERLGVSSRGLIQGGLGLVAIAGVIVWWSPGEVVSALGLGLLGLGLGPIFPTTLAILAKLVSPRLVPTTIGFVCSLSILGAAIFPTLAGLVVTNFGLGWFMPYIGLLGLLTLAAWLVFLWQAGSEEGVEAI